MMDDTLVKYQNQLVEFFKTTRQGGWNRSEVVRRLEVEYAGFLKGGILRRGLKEEDGAQEPEATISTPKGYTGFVHYTDFTGTNHRLEIQDGLVVENTLA